MLLHWFKVTEVDALPEGRVQTVSIERGDSVLQICLTHHQGRYAALDNACPHQGGPLGEGSIECNQNGECYLRCPWHGWDFDPISGKPPGGYDDGVKTYSVDVREDGIYVGLEPESDHRTTVTDVMAASMKAWGLTHVFGMVGHSNLGLADAIRRQCLAGQMDYIGIRHEGAAAFAASAFGKLTGRPAACLTIAGPGATNLTTGCWDARVDGAPLLALTGQVKQQFLGPGYFQDLPLLEAFAPVAGFNQMVLPDSNHGELMGMAVKNALLNRGVAHLVFPDDVQTIPAKEGQRISSPEGRVAEARIQPSEQAFEQAVQKLRSAKRPVMILGHGARQETKALLSLAEELRCPVLTTFKGKGLIGDQGAAAGGHPLGAGVLGRSGTPVASWFMNESDLLLVFGASFSNHTGITPKKDIIQVDFERKNLGKFHAVAVPMWAEIGVTARRFLQEIRGKHACIDQSREVEERWKIWRAEKTSRLQDDRGKGISSIAVFDAMNQVIPTDAILAVDVGNNTYSFGRYFEASGHQSVLMSGYLGSIGFGYPAAMGAWAATQAHRFSEDPYWRQFADRAVIAVTGDGGFGQYAWEVNSAVNKGINLTHVLLNNHQLGKISKEQKAGHWEVWQTGLTNPDVASYVNSCGGLGIRVRERDELTGALQKALAFDGPATVEVLTDPELI
ncbi:MAG: thiamine pyrophosphate-binding protein [Planctomycetota bacterium]|nr:MAG: thiamine pyrophosphate-binding protein [Planctomycetota bacterium]